MIFGAVVALGLLLAFGGLPFPPWLAYCVGLIGGASLVGMLMTYMLAWASTLDDGADAHHFHQHRN